MGRRQVCGCAGVGPCRESGDCRCGSREKISILSVSHVLGRGYLEGEFHKELIPNCMEPWVASWSLFVKSGCRLRSGQSWKCRLERQCAMETFTLPTIGRQQGVVRGSAGIILVSHVTTVARQAHLDIPAWDVCTLLLTKSILGLPKWIRAGYQGVGDVRPACLFPLVKSKCILDSGVRRCYKAGHSCMKRVIDCSSVLHKMAWRSVALAIRAVSRLSGSGCEFFDTSQLRCELDSMFQELDTPPSRCCWRCGCAMSCVSLISADIDQAFEACSASAVLPARRHISQSYESRFSSNSVLVRRGRRELCEPGRSQSFGRGWFSFFNSCPGPGVVQLHVGFVGNVGVHGVVVVLGAAELVWLDQRQKHRQLGFLFGGPVRSCISWKRCVMLLLAAACFVVAAFFFFCVPVTRYHTRWYREQARLSTRGWMWNCASLDSTWRLTSRIRIDRGCTICVHSRCRLFFPGLVFSKVDWVPFGVLYRVFWPEPRCWDSRDILAWLVSWRIWWSWCIWDTLCPSFGACPLFALQPCFPDLSQNCTNVVVFL